ncbi:MAG: Crp/Fnr family transcriptional regulator, partial [Blastocatellia bacterium]
PARPPQERTQHGCVPQKGIAMLSSKGQHRQPLNWIPREAPQELTFQPAVPRRSSGSSGGYESKQLRASCSVLALNLKSRIPIHRLDDFLEPAEDPATFYRRFNSRKATATAGTVLYPLPSTKPSLIFIQRGMVELEISCGGRMFSIAQIVSDEVFGDAPLLGMTTLNTRARAVNRCRFLVIPAEVIQSSVLASHTLALEWLKKVSGKLGEAQQESVFRAFSTARQRLAALLLKLADKDGVISGTNHMALAGRLGVYRETVSTRLREMKADGIVSVSREMITILDRERLQRIATIFEGARHE